MSILYFKSMYLSCRLFWRVYWCHCYSLIGSQHCLCAISRLSLLFNIVECCCSDILFITHVVLLSSVSDIYSSDMLLYAFLPCAVGIALLAPPFLHCSSPPFQQCILRCSSSAAVRLIQGHIFGFMEPAGRQKEPEGLWPNHFTDTVAPLWQIAQPPICLCRPAWAPHRANVVDAGPELSQSRLSVSLLCIGSRLIYWEQSPQLVASPPPPLVAVLVIPRAGNGGHPAVTRHWIKVGLTS